MYSRSSLLLWRSEFQYPNHKIRPLDSILIQWNKVYDTHAFCLSENNFILFVYLCLNFLKDVSIYETFYVMYSDPIPKSACLTIVKNVIEIRKL